MRGPLYPCSILVATVATLAACSPEHRSPPRAAGVDTLPSGTIVVHNPARGYWDSAAAWSLVEDLRIGSADSGPTAFGRIAALAVDGAGRIYVLDRQAQDVRVFDADGRYVRTIGRKGGGPGEFQRANGLAIGPAGDLWVVDPGSRRYSVFDTAGRLVSSHQRGIPDFGYGWSGGFAAGALWDSWGVFPPKDPATRRTGFFRFDINVGYTDSLLLSPFSEGRYEVTTRGRPRWSSPVPFAAEELVALDERGFVWRAVSDEYRFAQLSFSGDTVRLVSREYRRRPVTKADRERALAPMRAFMGQHGAEPDPSRIPSHRPALIGMLVDDRGYLWVLPVGEGGGSGLLLDVFDPEGRYLGKVRTPMRSWIVIPHPLIRGDVFYCVDRDSLDVLYVLRLRIEGRGGSP